MPLRRALSIVLRTYHIGEADKLVVFFSLQYGKLRGVARAARRPRSRFGGSLEIGTEIDLTFFEKEGRELVSLDRCDIVRSRFSQLGEPILASTLGYVTDLVDGFLQEREPNARVYRLLRGWLWSEIPRALLATSRPGCFDSPVTIRGGGRAPIAEGRLRSSEPTTCSTSNVSGARGV